MTDDTTSVASRFLPYALPALLAMLYIVLLSEGINLVVADLGRHIMNGKLLLDGDWATLATNTYSYTHPDWAVLNHHWLSGVFFYAAFLLGGFEGTHLLFIIASVAAFLLFFRIAREKSRLLLASACALILMPIIAERTEVRPEAFSCLLAGVYFLLLLYHREGGIRAKMLAAAIGLLQILWVNIHIYFFVGWVLVGTFLFESAAMQGLRHARTKALGLCFAIALLASFINPFTWRGALAPFTIFHEYGYRLVENQPVWFLQKVLNRPNLLYFEIAFAALVASFILVFVRNRRHLHVAETILGFGFGAAAALALRNFTIFGLFALPLFAENVANAFPRVKTLPSRARQSCVAVVVAIIVLLFASGEMRKIYAYPPLALGLLPGNERSAAFFLNHHLEGPIFNNYDIGGYLIFYLYPKEKVFVDNRPEAYPASFFQNEYIPMQENETLWREQEKRYGFNVIFFSHRDYTPWAQQFLIARVNDPAWAPVYADDYAIIFLKRTEKNAALIKQFEIPRGRFGATGH
jgi:hypothetical protein